MCLMYIFIYASGVYNIYSVFMYIIINVNNDIFILYIYRLS